MNKSEVTEVKKFYKKDTCSVRKIVGCYVNVQKEIVSTFNDTFLNKPDDEFFKYLEIFKKGLSGTVGKNIRTFDFENDNMTKKSLLELKNSDLENEDFLQLFYKKIIDNYTPVENFMILLINNAVDIFRKSSDEHKNEESDEVYSYISCYICPVKLEKPGLSFNPITGLFEKKDRRWCIDAPVVSFLYPSFEDRTEDANYITIYTKKTDYTYDSFLEGFLEFSINLSPEEQMMKFQDIVETSIKDNPQKIEVIKNIHDKIYEKLEVSNVPIELNKEDVKEILTESGITQTALNEFDENYDETIGKKKLTAINVMNSSLQVKTPDIVIKVKPDKTSLVQSETIDGKKCLIIDIGSSHEVEVNGINL